MEIIDRLGYALIGGVFGAILGVGCWWLYGLAYSRMYDGPGIDPVLFHWVKYAGATFALLGFVLRERLGDALGNAISAIFHFEEGHAPGEGTSPWVGLLVLGMLLVAIWFMFR